MRKHAYALAALLVAFSAFATAAIERLDLSQMVQRADGAVHGRIVAKKVIRIDHPKDGPELYYTTLTVEGVNLASGQPQTVDVTFPGGFISPTEGVYNSEAPSADDQKVGNDVVAFWKREKNMGGDLAGNALMTSHGGLYRTIASKNGRVVQGRGDGYAVPANIALDDLRARIQTLTEQKNQQR
jgi:hypothetical protein